MRKFAFRCKINISNDSLHCFKIRMIVPVENILDISKKSSKLTHYKISNKLSYD